MATERLRVSVPAAIGEVEAGARVVPGGAVVERERARVGVVDEAAGRVVPRHAVADGVRGRQVHVAAAQLEAVAVTGVVRDVPAVEAVALGHAVLDHDRREELPGVQPVVGVVPQPRAAHDVAGAGALLDGQAVSALAVVAGSRLP